MDRWVYTFPFLHQVLVALRKLAEGLDRTFHGALLLHDGRAVHHVRVNQLRHLLVKLPRMRQMQRDPLPVHLSAQPFIERLH